MLLPLIYTDTSLLCLLSWILFRRNSCCSWCYDSLKLAIECGFWFLEGVHHVFALDVCDVALSHEWTHIIVSVFGWRHWLTHPDYYLLLHINLWKFCQGGLIWLKVQIKAALKNVRELFARLSINSFHRSQNLMISFGRRILVKVLDLQLYFLCIPWLHCKICTTTKIYTNAIGDVYWI